MRKGEWYLVSDEAGVLSITHVLRVDHAEGVIDLDLYARAYQYVPFVIDKHPLYMFFADVMASDRNGKTMQRVPAKTARNLLKLLQRKLP